MNYKGTKWNLSSRIHKLNQFPNQGIDCYVKRDDELGCGITGSKLRKYSSLMPFLINKGISHLIIIAGPQSNNLLAALQMAREYELQVTALLLKPWSVETKGNFKLSRMFLDESEIIWVDRNDWTHVDSLADEFNKTLKTPGFILSEGASVQAALLGAMSLATDIISNELAAGLNFQHILVDAGTGFTAAALIKGLADMGHQAKVHVLLLADNEDIFTKKLIHWLGRNPENYKCFYPRTAKAFGSVNQKVKDEIKRMAKEEGILVDPVYSAKLFQESRLYIETEGLKGNALIIHSGGALSLAGFSF